MGLLDDAIREHLELKRRRGADPAEMERLEREALGPVRRGPDELENGSLPSEEHEAAEYTEEPPSEWSESLDEELPAAEAAGPPESGDEELGPLADTALFDHEADMEPTSPPAEPVPPDPAPAPPALDHLNVETAEYDVEAEHAKEQETGDEEPSEDVLEETPEFLQDAPDHDRLWFEQRPPRDFDFDE